MKTIIAGSRSVTNRGMVEDAIRESGFDITEVVSGGCRGVDLIGEAWAFDNKIPVKRFPANWKVYGKVAGPIRNLEMAHNADALIAVWDGRSRGTDNMISEAQYRGLKVFVYRTEALARMYNKETE